ncbi:MAG TPA: nucleotidyltransferase domain-containing protein [Solirubrobacteraceae bacterium]|jgi:predicted nucleotidyltransferase|nr:nucleotidyltransferase domain-containing protein [Solirubrobacteraceae bacterium]
MTAAEATVERAGRALVEATTTPTKVILFGSRARGDADDRSDFDFLVIEREVHNRFGEMVRLGRILGRLLIPADVVVVSQEHARKWESVKGTMIHEAMSEGRVVAES